MTEMRLIPFEFLSPTSIIAEFIVTNIKGIENSARDNRPITRNRCAIYWNIAL
jgi:hypothetical protein